MSEAGKRLVFVLPFAMLAGLVFIKLNDPSAYLLLVLEDGLVENLQVFGYFLGAAIAFRHAVFRLAAGRGVGGGLYLLMGVFCFFVAMEEVSWGQRILGFEPSTIFIYNTQNESTVHNLVLVQPYLYTAFCIAGIWGGMAWYIFARQQGGSHRLQFGNLVPPWHLSSYFLLCFLIHAIMGYIYPLPAEHRIGQLVGSFLVSQDQEIGEFMLASGILLHLLFTTKEDRASIRALLLRQDNLSEGV